MYSFKITGVEDYMRAQYSSLTIPRFGAQTAWTSRMIQVPTCRILEKKRRRSKTAHTVSSGQEPTYLTFRCKACQARLTAAVMK